MTEVNRDFPVAIAVRQLRTSEIDEVVPVYLDAFRGMTDRQHITDWLQTSLRSHPQKICYGAWLYDTLLGYAVWAEKGGFRARAVWELEQIAVLAAHRRKGVGAQLIRESLKDITAYLGRRGAKIKLVMVTTGVSNKAAEELYRKALGAKSEAVISNVYDGDEQVMIARFEEIAAQENSSEAVADSVSRGSAESSSHLELTTKITNIADADRALLLAEYSYCQAGYDSRDRIIPEEVRNVGLIFGGLTAVLIFAADVLRDPAWFRPAVGIVGVFGFLLLLGFFMDIEANSSSRRALRKRSEQIEELISPQVDKTVAPPLCTWRCTIPKRNRYGAEKKLKALFSYLRKLARKERSTEELESDVFISAVFLSLFLWVALVWFTWLYMPPKQAKPTQWPTAAVHQRYEVPAQLTSRQIQSLDT